MIIAYLSFQKYKGVLRNVGIKYMICFNQILREFFDLLNWIVISFLVDNFLIYRVAFWKRKQFHDINLKIMKKVVENYKLLLQFYYNSVIATERAFKIVSKAQKFYQNFHKKTFQINSFKR